MADTLANWMKNINDGIQFKHIVMPASHDAGMVKSYCSKTLKKDNYSTQLLPVYEQLTHGSRQLDLRISKDDSRNYAAFHGGNEGGTDTQSSLGLRAYGESWKSICEGLADFITENPSEFVILKMDKQDMYSIDIMRMLLEEVNSSKAIPVAPFSPQYRDLSECKIGQLRGRLYVCAGNKYAYDSWNKIIPQNHGIIKIGQWNKAKKAYGGVDPVDESFAPAFRYTLVGDSMNSLDPRKSKKALVNGIKLKAKYLEADKANSGRRKTGLRGIWFNNISLLQDIKVKSDKDTWHQSKKNDREAIWLAAGPGRQNVASLDFVDVDKCTYIINKNPQRNWKGGRAPKWLSLI